MTLRSRYILPLLLLALLPAGRLPAMTKMTCVDRLAELLGHPVSIEGNTFMVTDRSHSEFHITGTLIDGRLKISPFMGYTNGTSSTIDAAKAVKQMLKHFGDDVNEVSVQLSRLASTGEGNYAPQSEEPMLLNFNGGWTAAPASASQQQKIDKAAKATAVGKILMGSKFGFTKVGMKNTMGQPGRLISLELTFEKPTP